MTYQQIIDTLDARLHYACKTYENAQITNFVAGDLMSDILFLDDVSFLLITSLNTEQSIRTAEIVGARGVLLVNGKQAPASLVQLAEDLDKTLITSPKRMFAVCTILGRILQEEGRQL